MIKRLLPAILWLSACEAQIPTSDDTHATVKASSYLGRDPVLNGSSIVQFQAIDDNHVFVLDGNHTLFYTTLGSGIDTSQAVQTNVGWFVAAPQSPNSSGPAIWIKDMQNNLYQWQLGWAPNGGYGQI